MQPERLTVSVSGFGQLAYMRTADMHGNVCGFPRACVYCFTGRASAIRLHQAQLHCAPQTAEAFPYMKGTKKGARTVHACEHDHRGFQKAPAPGLCPSTRHTIKSIRLWAPFCRTDIDSESSTPAIPSASTPSRLRPLSSALEERANSLSSAASSDDIPAAQDLQPSSNPAALLSSVLQQLQQANTAKRKELDWQMQNQVHYLCARSKEACLRGVYGGVHGIKDWGAFCGLNMSAFLAQADFSNRYMMACPCLCDPQRGTGIPSCPKQRCLFFIVSVSQALQDLFANDTSPCQAQMYQSLDTGFVCNYAPRANRQLLSILRTQTAQHFPEEQGFARLWQNRLHATF